MGVGDQLIEAFRLHAKGSRKAARAEALAMRDAVSITDPERVRRAYPHEVSGGMGQRIMIAMMLTSDPDILNADEPTGAPEVSVRRQVLTIMEGLLRDRGMGLIFISHDLNLVAASCDRVLIMYAGRLVETCAGNKLHEAPTDRLAVLDRDAAWAEAPGVLS
ncbi:peptide/nickel transport system ATP-binding protein [Jannaschia seohaensis]|uniref:Peptide/nickel transport system ATP-binding protein n=1 Tax=Jannaschia seohaensis TaxID=475081 RepID=A0A2Y9A2L0_9RHOB|nr:peptide/nickel transport system ATP-binding protein [Jannaschia seohaensis]SSA38106.1 peptide/nickel transport system ATP-binding protein [Jannaschia seohaensis]